MISATTKLINQQGMHMRTAKLVVEALKPFKEATVTFKFKDKLINAKSIVKIMAAGMKFNDEVTIEADGPEAETALAAVKKLFDDSFYE
jgi:phosphocarrier protein